MKVVKITATPTVFCDGLGTEFTFKSRIINESKEDWECVCGAVYNDKYVWDNKIGICGNCGNRFKY